MALLWPEPVKAAFAEPVFQRIDQRCQLLGAGRMLPALENTRLPFVQGFCMRHGQHRQIHSETWIDMPQLLAEQANDPCGVAGRKSRRHGLTFNASVRSEKAHLESEPALTLGFQACAKPLEKKGRSPLQIL